MSNERELELLHRRDAILRETMDLTSDVVRSLEQQQQLASDTKENLDHQNAILAQANRKMQSMNRDLSAVVTEMNEIEAHRGCLCCHSRRSTKKKSHAIGLNEPIVSTKPKTNPTISTTKIPALVEDNEQEQRIVEELNQMKNQFLLFQDQIQTINQSLDEGDVIIHQLNDETGQYMNAITIALTKAEKVLGKKFLLEQQRQSSQMAGQETTSTLLNSSSKAPRE